MNLETLRKEAHDAQEEYVAEATAHQRESFASETLCSGCYRIGHIILYRSKVRRLRQKQNVGEDQV